MEFHIETERLILREFRLTDVRSFFKMDSKPEVHKYLGENPVQNMEQAEKIVESIRKQYVDNGIGRWAAIEKSSGEFIGWSGLKFITEPENNKIHFHDVGYRLDPQFWGKGYATESAMAALHYGFNTLGLKEIIGMANEDNKASIRALEKCGLKFVEKFMWKHITCNWMEITKEEWENKKR